ncbi:MAG: histidinol dehydrogenase [Desulfobacterales bacterium]|nr:histidinol dehydrogenase [Desulfobacterales bacterium]
MTDIAVSDDEREDAYEHVDAKIIESLIEAHARIERFHELQKPRDLWLQEMEPGIVLGVKTTPLNRVGLYIPGGRAAYPSSALMCAVPARVAGVKEICACSPPPIKPLTLVALDIAGVTEIYSAGGAQAVAAMALGYGIHQARAEDCRARQCVCHAGKDDAPRKGGDRFPGRSQRDRDYCRCRPPIPASLLPIFLPSPSMTPMQPVS